MSNKNMINRMPAPASGAGPKRAVTAFAAIIGLLLPAGVPPAFGQQRPGVIADAQRGPALKIFVLTGENGVNRLTLGLSAQTVVEVRDQNDLPVTAAEVVFTLPATGPGGDYGGQKQFRTKTDNQGQAAPAGFRPSGTGRFQIRVEATAGGRTGSAVINQINSERAIATTYEEPKRRTKRWVLLSLIGAGATIGAVLATRGSGSSDPISIVLAPGPVTVGGPR